MKGWVYGVIAGLVVLAIVAGVGGFVLGTGVGSRRAADVRRQFLAERTGGNGFGQWMGASPNGGQGPGGPAVTGTVKSVNGDTVTVSTRNGDVQVKVASDTAVRKMADGTIADIQPGQRITVVGDSANGMVTARSVQLVPLPNQ